jgi:hypothetical protein
VRVGQLDVAAIDFGPAEAIRDGRVGVLLRGSAEDRIQPGQVLLRTREGIE